MLDLKWRTDSDTELALNWRVSENYWFKEQGLTEEEYEIVVRGCGCSAAGFCESCMGNNVCELRAKTIVKLRQVKNHHLYYCEYPLFCAATKRPSCVGCKAHKRRKRGERS